MNSDLEKASEIAKKVIPFAKSIIKKDKPLVEIAEEIEGKIIEFGAKPAFPTNLSIDEIAAHDTPVHNDERKAQGLLKVDLGIRINKKIIDCAFSVDLTPEKKYKELIETSEKALQNAIDSVKKNLSLGEIGQSIQATAEKNKFTVIINLSGHEIDDESLHAGLVIPNYNNKSSTKLKNGTFAIEPFITAGVGKIYDGKPSGIYILESDSQPRDKKAREVLEFIKKEYSTFPFCSRWIVKKFSSSALISLKQLEQQGILHNYAQLIEKSHSPVSQSETTILKENDKVFVLA